jgi:dihydroorotase
MTAMLALGLTIEQVVPMVTTNPAKMLDMADALGHLKAGAVADVSVIHDERGQWTLSDNEKTKLKTSRMLRPYFCLRAGKRHDADAAILPPLAVAA